MKLVRIGLAIVALVIVTGIAYVAQIQGCWSDGSDGGAYRRSFHALTRGDGWKLLTGQGPSPSKSEETASKQGVGRLPAFTLR